MSAHTCGGTGSIACAACNEALAAWVPNVAPGSCTCGDVETLELSLLRDMERCVRKGYSPRHYLEKLDELRAHPEALVDPHCPEHAAQEVGP